MSRTAIIHKSIQRMTINQRDHTQGIIQVYLPGNQASEQYRRNPLSVKEEEQNSTSESVKH